MHIEGFPFSTIDWCHVVPVENKGETGSAFWQTVEIGNIRVRVVEFTRGFKAPDWCNRGHVVYVLEGEIVMELDDGREFKLSKGMSYQVAQDSEVHRSYSEKGAKLFIVD